MKQLELLTTALALSLTLACGHGGDAVVVPEGPPPTPGARAVLGDAEGLYAIDPADGARTRLVAQAVSWCRTDPRSDALWFTTAAADMDADDHVWRYTLWVLDLARDGAAPVRVATLPEAEIALTWPDEQVDVPPPHHFRVLATLQLTTTPAVAPLLGCDGDQSWYCYGSEDADGHPLLSDELVELQRTLSATALEHADVVAALAARGASGRFHLDAPTPSAPSAHVKVPAAACEEVPEDCGRAVPVPGTDLVAVIVANSRGDFYHEDRRLYDPSRGRFLDPALPAVATPAPAPEGEPLGTLEVLPGGRFWLLAGRLVDRAHGVVAEGERACGWTVPSYRYDPAR